MLRESSRAGGKAFEFDSSSSLGFMYLCTYLNYPSPMINPHIVFLHSYQQAIIVVGVMVNENKFRTKQGSTNQCPLRRLIHLRPAPRPYSTRILLQPYPNIGLSRSQNIPGSRIDQTKGVLTARFENGYYSSCDQNRATVYGVHLLTL